MPDKAWPYQVLSQWLVLLHAEDWQRRTYIHTYLPTYIGHPFNTLGDLEHLLHNFAGVYIYVYACTNRDTSAVGEMAVSTRQVNSFMQKVYQQTRRLSEVA